MPSLEWLQLLLLVLASIQLERVVPCCHFLILEPQFPLKKKEKKDSNKTKETMQLKNNRCKKQFDTRKEAIIKKQRVRKNLNYYLFN